MKQESPKDVPAFWAKVLTEKGYNVSSEDDLAKVAGGVCSTNSCHGQGGIHQSAFGADQLGYC